MLLVPLLAVSEFKCQLNAYNFVTVTECFMRGFSTDRGPSHGTGVPPSALGSLSSWSVCDSSCESDSAAQPGPGVQLFLLSDCDCVCTHQHLLGCGPGAQTGSSSTQTNILCHSLSRYMCACVCVCECIFVAIYRESVCNQHTNTVHPLYSSFTLRDCVT